MFVNQVESTSLSAQLQVKALTRVYMDETLPPLFGKNRVSEQSCLFKD